MECFFCYKLNRHCAANVFSLWVWWSLTLCVGIYFVSSVTVALNTQHAIFFFSWTPPAHHTLASFIITQFHTWFYTINKACVFLTYRNWYFFQEWNWRNTLWYVFVDEFAFKISLHFFLFQSVLHIYSAYICKPQLNTPVPRGSPIKLLKDVADDYFRSLSV